MTRKSILVYGAGGHGKCVADVLLARNSSEFKGFVDDSPSAIGGRVLGRPVFTREWFQQQCAEAGKIAIVLGIGNNWVRNAIAESCVAAGVEILTVVHPSATISNSAQIGSGSAILAGAMIGPDALVGRGAIINSGAAVEHDVKLGDYSHVSTNVAMGGAASLGDFSMLGVGSVVRPRALVGKGSIVGAGSVVIGDLPAGVVAYGVPARIIRLAPQGRPKN